MKNHRFQKENVKHILYKIHILYQLTVFLKKKMNFGENIMDEKECHNCKHVEFDIGLCTQYYCGFHEKLVKMDDPCDDWSKTSY